MHFAARKSNHDTDRHKSMEEISSHPEEGQLTRTKEQSASDFVPIRIFKKGTTAAMPVTRHHMV